MDSREPGRAAVTLFLALCLANFGSATKPDSEQPDQNWHQWRGPLGTGASLTAHPPVSWSESKNVRWKTPLPGLGHSTPVVWQDTLYLTAAVPVGEAFPPRRDNAPGSHDNLAVTRSQEFVCLAIRRSDGKLLWKKTLTKAIPHEGGHYTASLASASPVTDGEHVYAFFGSQGLYCLTTAGELVWQKDFGKMQTKHAHGEGASPALYGETIVANWDHEAQSFLIALDAKTGKERWKVLREEVTSWATPLVVEVEGAPQVVVSGTERVRGYDLATGKVIWECGGLSANIVATPVSADGLLFAGSSYEKQAMLAIRLAGARGDITDSERLIWKRIRGTPYVPSPLLYGDSIYFLRHYQGILSRVGLQSGDDVKGPFRLGPIREVYASPVAADSRVYITDRDGLTMVISHEEEPRLLGVNQLEDSFSASAALAGNEMFLRGEKYLYCLADAEQD